MHTGEMACKFDLVTVPRRFNNNQKKNSVYDPTVYSPYRMNNAESKVDATCITFSYWRNLLRIGIAPKKDTGNDEVRFDTDNAIYILLFIF